MTIPTRVEQGITILSPKGRITIGSGDVAMRAAIQEALDAGAKNILVNMHDVTIIDSSGVGELIHAYTTTTNHGGKLKLCRLPAKVTDILTVTQLITVFDVYDDEMEAIESFE